MLSLLQAFLSSFGVCYCNTSWSEWNFITKYVWETGWHIACTWSVCWTSRSQWSQGLRHMARSTCVVFFGKTLYSQSAFPHPEVKMGTCKLSGKPIECSLQEESIHAKEFLLESALAGWATCLNTDSTFTFCTFTTHFKIIHNAFLTLFWCLIYR